MMNHHVWGVRKTWIHILALSSFLSEPQCPQLFNEDYDSMSS